MSDNTKNPDRPILLSLFALLTTNVVLSFMTWQRGTSAQDAVLLLILAHVPWGIAMWKLWGEEGADSSMSVVWLFGGAFALRAVLLPGTPFFSDDVYRFVWDGKVQAAGFGPWELPPDADALRHLRDGDWHRINNPELRTIYPPVAQLLFRAADAIASSVYTVKGLALLADMAVVSLIFLLAGGQFSGKNRRHVFFATALYGWNPLVCTETALAGHLLEPAGIACTLGAIYAVRGAGARRFRDISAGGVLAMGAGIKLAPLLMCLSLGRRSRLLFLSMAVCSAAVFLPVFMAGTDGVETLDGFARRWEANSGLFRLFKWAGLQLVGALNGTTDPQAMIHLQFLDGPARLLQPTFFALHKDGAYDPAFPGAFPLMDIALAIARGCCAAVFAGVWIYCVLRKVDTLRAGLTIFGALVVVTPVLHPWYLLWVLPFAALLRKWSWFVFGAALSLVYLSLDLWWSHGIWREEAWILGVEYALLGYVLLEGRILPRKRKGEAAVDGMST